MVVNVLGGQCLAWPTTSPGLSPKQYLSGLDGQQAAEVSQMQKCCIFELKDT